MKVLLIEDDQEMADNLTSRFREHGISVEHTGNGLAGLKRASEGDFEVIVLDRQLPDLDGLSLVKRLREAGSATPVIHLTTMSGIDDRVQGLEAGADDYLVKPFAVAELVARVRVLARRAAASDAQPTVLRAGPLEMDLLQRTLRRAGRLISLMPQELRLLEYFMRNPNRVVTRTMLLENVWHIHFEPNTSLVESNISRLRSKLNEGFEEDLIHTLRATGYKLVVPD